MALFTGYRKIYWEGFVIKDLPRKFSILPIIAQNIATWQTVHFQDSDTLENLAHDYYGESSLHWVIMAMNGIVDPYYDLPLRPMELHRWIDMLYDNRHGTHHYEWEGLRVDGTSQNKYPITNEEYEIAMNETKRSIRILDAGFVPQVKSEMKMLLSRN